MDVQLTVAERVWRGFDIPLTLGDWGDWKVDVSRLIGCEGSLTLFSDLSTDMPLFDKVLSFFKNPSEEIRTAAAFAAGTLRITSKEAAY